MSELKGKYLLFLDDERTPEYCRDYQGDESVYDTEEFIIAKSFDEFYDKIKAFGIPEFVSFDYQILGVKNGLECATFLKFECEELGVEIPPYSVHSGWPGIFGEFIAILGKPKRYR